MIGLEYILSLYNMQHIDLAERLGIRKQNINLWIKGRQNIPKKYLPILEEIFGIKQEYFIKELNEIERLEIQKEKLKKDLKPVIKEYEQQFLIGETNDLVEVPIYDKEEINTMERAIEKARLMSRFKKAMDIVDDNPYIDTYKLIVELVEKVQHEPLVHKTVEALGHYFEILQGTISTSIEQDEFESEIFEVFDDNNF
ncbi:helix-turn-helix domain-containing protein [Clostridium algidicarnis]|uniref:helix-turn-helix domain-containing protein n=1 Tax=Clostridium algidicarnis TaxID=37659 RepID=UPI001C0A98CA|nr:helix-turn-helix domain-containing protein [Clostridium algidicarnis]MBU3227091.1 helix-turn-helix domain-containing protein [Clostridium algidicarnis]MBU3250616.1 helix-turn-helix domain-containing protein [Clostridium algidicarnis]